MHEQFHIDILHDIQKISHNVRKNNLFNTRSYQTLPSAANEDISKTAITILFAMYEFVNMSFGLRNAAKTFQCFIDSVLEELYFYYAYIDDILVASTSLEKHYKHLKILLRRLEEYGVVINLAKYVFGQEEIKFLGYLVSKEGI